MKWLSKTYIWVIMAFLYAPIGVLIFFSFNQSKSRSNFTGFTLDWYVKLFHNDLIIQSLINTLIVALVSSIIATVIGTIAAVGINSMKNWKRSIIMNITYLPIVNPEIVTRRVFYAAVCHGTGASCVHVGTGVLNPASVTLTLRPRGLRHCPTCSSQRAARACGKWIPTRLRGGAGPGLSRPYGGAVQGQYCRRSCPAFMHRLSAAPPPHVAG